MSELIDCLQLIRSENVGPVTYRRLIERYGSAAAALKAIPELAKKGGGRAPKIADRAACEKEFAAINKQSVELLALGTPSYPARLAQIDDAPPLLMVKGHTSLLQKPAIAIVGARNASLNARKFTEKLARDLGEAGFIVVSGLARGIDGAAHIGSLASGTIGVLGGGVDVIYPEENRDLYDKMSTMGAIVSEAPLGYTAKPHDFLRRNRLISGLSQGVVVVEAAMQSGSLVTARLAGEQGREVFAVPGSPLDPRSTGTNNLLREGAVLVESANDVLRELRPEPHLAQPKATGLQPSLPPTDTEIDQARPQVLELLSPTPVQIDDLLRECPFALGVVQMVLVELELAGRLQRSAGGRVALLAGDLERNYG